MAQTIEVSGRTLGWIEYGVPDGTPVVALHGSPDSHAIWKIADEAAKRIGVRIIAPDRPGFGRSDPDPGRTVLDWVADQRVLATHLGLERHGVLAISGGSPYATAVAWSEPEVVSHLGLLSCISPLNAPGVLTGTSRQVGVTFRLARWAPESVLRAISRLVVRLATRDPADAEKRLIATRPPADRAVIERPEILAILRENLPNQFRDAGSIARELHLAARDWGFSLGDIEVPTTIWQGGLDDVHTPAMARWLADAIPGARLELEPDYATFNWIDRMDDVLGVFIEA